MKKVFVSIALLIGIFAGAMTISSFTIPEKTKTPPCDEINQGPKFAGLTFESRDGETLDFYSDKVIYHVKGANVSRRGDYKIGGISNVVHAVGKENRYITIDIYVADRIVKLEGSFTYKTSDGEVVSLTLNGKNWSRW